MNNFLRTAIPFIGMTVLIIAFVLQQITKIKQNIIKIV